MSAFRGPELKKKKKQQEEIIKRGGISKILYACQQGNVGGVRALLQSEPGQALEKDRSGKTTLHYCTNTISKRAAQVADLLVMAAPDLVETKDEDGFTPLHLAVIAGNLPLVTFLLANGANIEAVDNEKHTVVHWATVCGETEALRVVLASGAPNSTPDIHGGYPLHYAAQMCGGDKDASLGLQVLDILLSSPRIAVTVEDDDGRIPLLWAASAGSTKAVLALIRAGSPVEAHDKDGLTALHCAASRGHTECLDAMISLCGANPDVIDSNGCTALHYAVTLGHADATSLLLGHGVDVNRQDRKGRTPAHCGCAKGQFETVKMITAKGANLWLRNARGDFPLHEAAASGRRDLVKWLLDIRPSNVNARNNDGRCLLHLAALNDNTDMCKVLLDAGAQVNPVLRTSKNTLMTPLDCALQRGFRATAKFLQLHGGHPAKRQPNTTAPDMPLNTGVSLHIRNDVTVWDNSSSDEKKQSEKRGGKKKSYKRKIDYKLQRSKLEVGKDSSASETEVEKPSHPSRPTGHQGEIFIYANEVNINDRFGGLRIKQNGEVLLTDSVGSKANQMKADEDNPIKESTTASSSKRPKSAKHKLKSSGNGKQSHIDDSKLPQEISAQIKQKSVESIDRMSIVSNTSNEDEGHKEVLVEASVHSPPHQEGEDEPNIQQVEIIQEENIPNEDIVTQQTEETSTTKLQTSPEPSKDIQPVSPTQEEEADNQPAIKVIPPSASTIASEKVPVDTTILHPNRKSPSPRPVANEENENPISNATVSSITSTSTTTSNTTTTTRENASDNKDEEHTTKTKTVTICEEGQDMEKHSKSEHKKHRSKNQQQKGSFKIVDKDFVRKRRECEKENTAETRSSEDIEDSERDHKSTSSTPSSPSRKEHKSFTIIDDEHEQHDETRSRKSKSRKQRSRSEEDVKEHEHLRRSKIPTSKSERNLERKVQSSLESRVPSLPYIDSRQSRSVSNLSAPMITSTYSDDRESVSDIESQLSSSARKKRFRKRSKTRGAKSAGSDYESSNLIDSGFEPSPRSSRIPKWRNMSDRGVCMTSVTQTIQSNIRRYHLERKIFQHLLDLKRLQIRSGQHNEAVLVKRAIEDYHKSCAATVGSGRYISQDYTFKSFENFLYTSLRKIQKYGAEHLRGLPENPKNPLLCTQSTHKCDHAIHAYTGVPCAAYIPKLDHHTIPKIGYDCKPGFLPRIAPKNTVTLELCHGSDKQIISLPAERLDQNKRYYVTFTVKGQEETNESKGNDTSHRHSKSD